MTKKWSFLTTFWHFGSTFWLIFGPLFDPLFCPNTREIGIKRQKNDVKKWPIFDPFFDTKKVLKKHVFWPFFQNCLLYVWFRVSRNDQKWPKNGHFWPLFDTLGPLFDSFLDHFLTHYFVHFHVKSASNAKIMTSKNDPFLTHFLTQKKCHFFVIFDPFLIISWSANTNIFSLLSLYIITYNVQMLSEGVQTMSQRVQKWPRGPKMTHFWVIFWTPIF